MKTAFEEVMEIRGEGMPENDAVKITGADPVFSTPFKLGETCASVLAGVGVAVSDIWELKTGRRQNVAIDARHAAAALRSTLYMQQPGPDGAFAPVVNDNHEAMLKITQPWPTKDGRWFLPHFGLPNLKERVLGVLGCEPTPESVSKAVAQWNALDLEAAIDEARACGGMVRSNAEWLAHPHGRALKAKPIVEIFKIADSDPEPFPMGDGSRNDRPLSGIRALDLTRILAGPIAARTLAENGADVLMVAAEHLPQIDEHVMDTSHGKRSCYLNLKTDEDAATLRQLVREGDVFSQGYRPGMLEGLGFGPEDLAQIRPG
ncbi:MAG: CoA transferase, partial [Alphaproteobacteria bacterium]|nr:CoA transferase [Alphaproteobacteria bacterium]